MSTRRIGAGLALFALACTSPPSEAAPADSSLIRVQLDSLWTTYAAAASAGDVDALARIYTDSLYLVELGLPTVRGSAEWRSVVTEIFAGVRILESSIRPELTELLGNQVLQIGEYRDVLQPAGQPAQAAYGRFAAVLRREDAGAWRLSRLVAFADSTVVHATTVE